MGMEGDSNNVGTDPIPTSTEPNAFPCNPVPNEPLNVHGILIHKGFANKRQKMTKDSYKKTNGRLFLCCVGECRNPGKFLKYDSRYHHDCYERARLKAKARGERNPPLKLYFKEVGDSSLSTKTTGLALAKSFSESKSAKEEASTIIAGLRLRSAEKDRIIMEQKRMITERDVRIVELEQKLRSLGHPVIRSAEPPISKRFRPRSRAITSHTDKKARKRTPSATSHASLVQNPLDVLNDALSIVEDSAADSHLSEARIISEVPSSVQTLANAVCSTSPSSTPVVARCGLGRPHALASLNTQHVPVKTESQIQGIVHPGQHGLHQLSTGHPTPHGLHQLTGLGTDHTTPHGLHQLTGLGTDHTTPHGLHQLTGLGTDHTTPHGLRQLNTCIDVAALAQRQVLSMCLPIGS